MELPKDLIEAVKNNKLVVFIGAGLSYYLKNDFGKKIGSWRDLVTHIVTYFKQKDYYTFLMEKSLECKDEKEINILNRLEVISKLPQNEIIEYVDYLLPKLIKGDTTQLKEHNISNPIPINHVKDYISKFCSIAPKNDLTLHEKICDLFDIIITTNYDNAFELAAKQKDKKLKTLLIDDDIPSKKHNKSELTLFKLHGSVFKPETMVVFPKDYAHLYEHRSHSIVSYLKQLLIERSILFIGAGMGDWQINNIFKKTKELLADTSQNHYILLRKKDYDEHKKKLGFLTPIYLTDFEKNDEQYWRDLNNIIDSLIQEKEDSGSKSIKTDFLKQANELYRLAILRKDKNLLEKCNELYAKAASSLYNREEELYSNWGRVLIALAKLERNEKIYFESIEKFKIACEISPMNDKNYHNLELANEALWQFDTDNIIEKNKDEKLKIIPVKVCLGKGNKSCNAINPIGNYICFRCNKCLGVDWKDSGHVSGAICKKCGEYIGLSGAKCASCGIIVPDFYEDIIKDQI